MTGTEAAEYSKRIAATLSAHAFDQTVLLITEDALLSFASGATGRRYQDHVFVWTEHYGHFFVHEDEVRDFRVNDVPSRARE